MHNDKDSALSALEKYFLLKLDSGGEHNLYLGANLKLIQLENGVCVWSLCFSKYVQEVIQKYERQLTQNLLVSMSRLVGNVATLCQYTLLYCQSIFITTRSSDRFCGVGTHDQHIWGELEDDK